MGRRARGGITALTEYAANRLVKGQTPGEVYADMTKRFGQLTPDALQSILTNAQDWVAAGSEYTKDVEELIDNPTSADNPILLDSSDANVLVTITNADGSVMRRTIKVPLNGTESLSDLMDYVDGITDDWFEKYDTSSIYWSIQYVR
jgi:hypothetical protein